MNPLPAARPGPQRAPSAPRPKKPSRALALTILSAALVFVSRAHALSFEEAATQLADDDYSVRELAEKHLQTLPLEEIPRIEALTRQADPERAFRARRALLYVRLRLAESVNPELAAKIARLPKLGQSEIGATFRQLMALDPGPMFTIAGLHSEILANRRRYQRVDEDILAELGRSLSEAAADSASGPGMDSIRVDLYQDPTLALLAEGYAKRHAENLTPVLPVYSRWVAQRPALVALFSRGAIPLEIARIQDATANPHEQVRGLLKLAAKFENPSDQRKLILNRMTQLLRENPRFPVESLDCDTGFTYFAALEENWDPEMDVTPYRQFRDRFKVPHPDPESSVLEATYILEKEGFNAALALALRQRTDRAAAWLGTWLRKHPDSVPDPLVIPPLRKEERRHAHLTGFFNTLVPFRSLAEMQDNPKEMAAFRAIAKQDKALDNVLVANTGRLAYFEWIQAGTLDESIPKHLAGSTDRLRELGRLLVTKPESMDLINPANQTAADLQRILLGMLEASPLAPEIAKAVFTRADRWQETHPDIWETDSFRFEIPRLESLAPTRNEALQGLLKLATGYDDETPAKGAALRAIRRFQAEAPDFPVANLNAAEAYLFFQVFGTKPDAKKLFGDAYLEFRRRFPAADPAAATCPLEVLVYLEAGDVEKAFGQALSHPPAAAGWVGEWLHEHPASLTRPLFVPFNRGNLYQEQCSALLAALVPWNTLEELDAHPEILAAFDVLAEAQVWIEVAARGDQSHIACHHFLRADRLDKAISSHLKGKGKALRQLGLFLAAKPDLLDSIQPANQQTPDLRAILDGLRAANPDESRRKIIADGVDAWRKVHPALPEYAETRPEAPAEPPK